MKDSPAILTPESRSQESGFTIRVSHVERDSALQDGDTVRRMLARWIAQQIVAKSGIGAKFEASPKKSWNT